MAAATQASISLGSQEMLAATQALTSPVLLGTVASEVQPDKPVWSMTRA